MSIKKIILQTIFLSLTFLGNAQLSPEIPSKSQLNLDLDALSLDISYAIKTNKKLMVGFGAGFGAGYTLAFIDVRKDRIFDFLNGRIFLGNQQLKKGFSWEAGFMVSIVGASEAIGIINNFYFRPFWGGKRWRIGTQIAYGFSGGTEGPLWTPLILRYSIHFPRKK